MSTVHFPAGLLRRVCVEPVAERSASGLQAHYGIDCTQSDAPMLIVAVPGIADSGNMGLLTTLVMSIRNRFALSQVVMGPTPWSLDVDIPAYAARLDQFIRSKVRQHPGCKLALVAFSLGGTAALYYLSKYWDIAACEPPLVLTMASPLVGSNRYQRAFDRWQLQASPWELAALASIVTELEPGSPVMTAVQEALVQHDVHALLSYGDPIVDRSSAVPVGFPQVEELNTYSASQLKRHFGFPQNRPVIDEVISLLWNHAQEGQKRDIAGRSLSVV